MNPIDLMLQAWGAAGARDGCLYVSTPITSGIRAYEAIARHGAKNLDDLRSRYKESWISEVVLANEKESRALANRLRVSDPLRRVVINPADIHINGWEDRDYDELWRRFIIAFPVTIIPVSGWEYSRGARVEISTALRAGRNLITPDGEELGLHRIETLMATADAKIATSSWHTYIEELPKRESVIPES